MALWAGCFILLTNDGLKGNSLLWVLLTGSGCGSTIPLPVWGVLGYLIIYSGGAGCLGNFAASPFSAQGSPYFDNDKYVENNNQYRRNDHCENCVQNR